MAQPLKSSLLFRAATSLVEYLDIKKPIHTKEFSEWGVAAPKVMVELIRQESQRGGGLDSVYEVLDKYLQLRTPESSDEILHHPSIRFEFLQQAESFNKKVTNDSVKFLIESLIKKKENSIRRTFLGEKSSRNLC